jgi:3-dehydroquinate synthase
LTLDDRNFRCGLAECVKHAMIERSAAEAEASGGAHPASSLLEFLIANADAIDSRTMAALVDLIARSARIKASIVAADERETAGVRALLNLGHTFAHAFESFRDLNLLHGEAVAIGLNAAMRCAVATGRLQASDAQRIRDLIQAFGLPLHLPRSAPHDRILTVMAYDKKASGGRLRLVLPRGVGSAEIVDDVAQAVVHNALHEVGATP